MSAGSIVKIGLTGGYGCGKSEVRRRLQAMGIATIDADSLAKKIATDDADAVAAIKTAFGAAMYDSAGNLQRAEMAARVFGNPEQLAKLNAIIHPRVFLRVDEQCADLARQGADCVVIEAALFYETGWHKQMEAMVVVTAPLAKRLAWLQKRKGQTEMEIAARLQHQMPVEEKARQADFVLDNAGSLEDLETKVVQLRAWILARRKT